MTDRFADTVLFADTIHTLDGSSNRATAVAIVDGLIAMVGGRESASAWVGAATQVIDLGTATLVPGLVDAHIHPVMGLDLARGVDLTACTTIAAVLAALADHANGLSDDDWVLGWGLDPNVYGVHPVTNDRFRATVGERPTFITVFDSHSALASDSALAFAGIDGVREFADASRIVVDADGRPTGLLLEASAIALLYEVIPPLRFADRVELLYELLLCMAKSGLTGGHVMDLAPDTFELLAEIERTRDLPIRLRISPQLKPGYTQGDLDAILRIQHRSGRRWQVEGVKLMIDGTIDNGTAWLYEPDSRQESTHSLWLDTRQYARAVDYLHAHHIPTATHAIGDNAIGFVAATLARLSPNGTRHRIEHIETMTDDVLRVIADGGIAASMQPTHCTHYVHAQHDDNWSLRLGPVRANRAWRTRDLRDHGVTLALGSDWPIAPFDPLAIMADAQLRRPAGQPGVEPVLPDQALTARQALEGYTTEVAAAIGVAGGTIEVGQPADLTVIQLDPLTAHPDELATSSIVMTMVGGCLIGASPRRGQRPPIPEPWTSRHEKAPTAPPDSL